MDQVVGVHCVQLVSIIMSVGCCYNGVSCRGKFGAVAIEVEELVTVGSKFVHLESLFSSGVGFICGAIVCEQDVTRSIMPWA